jgi:KUP system potassium uptake protein
VGGFKFCFIKKSVPSKGEDLSAIDQNILNTKYAIRRMAGAKTKWYGLDNSTLIRESVPLFIPRAEKQPRIRRQQASDSAAE